MDGVDGGLDEASVLFVASGAVLSGWHRWLVTSSRPTRTEVYRMLCEAIDDLRESRLAGDVPALRAAMDKVIVAGPRVAGAAPELAGAIDDAQDTMRLAGLL